MLRRRPRSPLFPYTTLFRSRLGRREPGLVLELDLLARSEPLTLQCHGRSLGPRVRRDGHQWLDRKSTRLNSSHTVISYAVFCLKKKKGRKATGKKRSRPARG